MNKEICVICDTEVDKLDKNRKYNGKTICGHCFRNIIKDIIKQIDERVGGSETK